MTAVRHHAVWLSLVLGVPPTAVAQAGLTDGAPDSMPVRWTDVRARCVTPAPNPYDAPVARAACRVAGVTSLGAGDGREWYVVRYRRELTVRDSGLTDTLPLDELVLVGRAPGAPDSRVAWRWTSDRRDQFLDTAVAVPTAHGLLLQLQVCLNGTGGCGYQYYRLAAGRWRSVTQAFRDDLSARLRPGHTLHKGRTLDLTTLRGVWPVAAPGDANCCPSYRIGFRLRLDGDTLRLVEAGPLRRESGR